MNPAKLLELDVATERFSRIFSAPPSDSAQAFGRVNLIGEHTDYNGGFVLPTAIPQRTRVLVRRRTDSQVRAVSLTLDSKMGEYQIGSERKTETWLDYLQGVTKVLAVEGYPVGGFEVWIESEVPIGSGLSSSAALEVSLLRALREMFGFSMDDMTIAKLSQKVENDFVGARVGIMDPVAAAMATFGSALFLDTQNLSHQLLPLPMDRMDLVVISSGISHRNAGGGYNTRRAECERACELLGIRLLREIDSENVERLRALPEPLRRRARHVVTENSRVVSAVDAIRRGDVACLGTLFKLSHASMRNDYEVSIPEIDLMVRIASEDRRCYGARLTGGGFGGSIVALAHKAEGDALAREVAARYAEQSGQTPLILVPPPLA